MVNPQRHASTVEAKTSCSILKQSSIDHYPLSSVLFGLSERREVIGFIAVKKQFKCYAYSLFLVLGLLQSPSYAHASQDLTTIQRMADHGDATAQFRLGVSYAMGENVVQDAQQSVVWFRKAAEQGNDQAQFRLGFSYAFGFGVAQDEPQAVFWYRKAAEQGNTDAQKALAGSYISGKGVAKDVQQAVVWFRKAAEQGDGNAQFRLGASYAFGEGVVQDHSQAYVWSYVAATNGVAGAASLQNFMAEKLSESQLAEAQKLAGQYFEKYQPRN